MKSLTLAIALLTTVAFSSANACDETCRRDRAQSEYKVEFPSYLNWKFCEDTRMDFMTRDMKSVANYQSKNFDTRYKGGMRNIKNFVEQRKEWLVECDDYMIKTNKGRIFQDEKTTEDIFSALDSVARELEALIAGATYSSQAGEDSNTIMNEKFDSLLTSVDDHMTLMHLRGKYVTR